jgi:hypothetical protein
MITIIGKKVGRPDYTSDSFTATIPSLIRQQGRFFMSTISRDVQLGTNMNGYCEGLTFATFSTSYRGYAFYLTWIGVSVSLYNRISIRWGMVDLDKEIESERGIYAWTPEDKIPVTWGKAEGYGLVTINRGTECPAVLAFDENAPVSKYYPYLFKYTVGFWFMFYGEPNTQYTIDQMHLTTGMFAPLE